MSYNRKIYYMNFYESDEKKGNAGYIKVLESGGIQKAEVRLSGISTIFDGGKELEVLHGQTIISREQIDLRKGSGTITCGWEKEAELAGLSFRVLLHGGCSLDSQEKDKLYREEPIIRENVMEEEVKTVVIEKEREEPKPKMVQPQLESAENKESAEKEQIEGTDGTKEKVENRKWKQICKAYPHIKPFQDFRDYIKLDLKDMVLVSEKKYSLVENSFLLHGYYNYDHIILWRKEKTPVKYYIGVPGNFYEKEKQVAVLYGFESFEGAVEPAKEGDFGYYMTEVTI